MPHRVSGINFLLLSLDLIPISLLLSRLFLFLPHQFTTVTVTVSLPTLSGYIFASKARIDNREKTC